MSQDTARPRHKGRLQFSLRTAFVAMTLAAVGVAFLMRPALRQRRAVAAIQAVGGEVMYREATWLPQSTYLRRLLLRVLPVDCCHCVDNVLFEKSTGWSEELPAHLAALTTLEGLNLYNMGITDADLGQLAGLADMRALLLNRTQITDAALPHLKNMKKLETLELQRARVSDAGLVHLQGLTSLMWLDLSGTDVTDAGLAHLQNLPVLSTVITDGTRVTRDGDAEFYQALPYYAAQVAARAEWEGRRAAAIEKELSNER